MSIGSISDLVIGKPESESYSKSYSPNNLNDEFPPEYPNEV